MLGPKLNIYMVVDNFLTSNVKIVERSRADRYKDHHHQGDVEIVRLGIGA